MAFGMAHLREHIAGGPGILEKLAAAVRNRHDALRNTAGLNAEVFDALVLVAAGGWELADLRRGHQALMGLVAEMDERRQSRMVYLGSPRIRRRSCRVRIPGTICDAGYCFIQRRRMPRRIGA